MTEVEAVQRKAIVAEARTWLGTPYHHEARVKGAGVDCVQLLVGVFVNAGLIAPPEIPHYPPDWHLHRSAELYLRGLLAHASEIAGLPLPGDIALWRFGRCFSHGAIVVAWPRIIHAYVGRACTLDDADKALWLTFMGENTGDRGASRPRRFFSYW